jgi:hypothetical protein
MKTVPRSGYVAKPRVASTLGKTVTEDQPQRGCAGSSRDGPNCANGFEQPTSGVAGTHPFGVDVRLVDVSQG